MPSEKANTAILAQAVAAYLNLRKEKAALEAKHKEELLPIRLRMARAEDIFLEVLNDMGAQSIKTEFGTPYKKDVTNVKVEDWNAVLDYIREQGAWELLKKDLSKTAVMERIEAGEHVPGASMSVYTKVYVQSK